MRLAESFDISALALGCGFSIFDIGGEFGQAFVPQGNSEPLTSGTPKANVCPSSSHVGSGLLEN